MRSSCFSLFLLIALGALASGAFGHEPIREIFVPFEDLNVVLDNDHHRVFLTREEYEALVDAAQSKPQAPVPTKVAIVSAQYDSQLEQGRVLLTGNLTIEVMEEGLFALPLEMSGVGVRAATLDGKPAPLARPEDLAAHHRARGPQLLVQGKGLHTLELTLTAPLPIAAAQQTLQVTLPTSAATRLKLSAPGNVEIKAGAAVISRQYDETTNRTHFELLPQHGNMAIVMSVNNRLIKDEQVVVARSVIVDEVTVGYERIHATVSYRVLHGAIDKLRLAIPPGFEVTTVDSVLLARWEEKLEAGDKKTLEISLREPATDQVVIHLTASRTPGANEDWLKQLQDWTLPTLEPLETAGQVAIIGLVLEDRLRPEKISTTGLLPIDSTALAAAIPDSVRQAEPGAPIVRQIAGYYAPAGNYGLSASLVRPPAEVKVAANSLLLIGDQGLSIRGGYAITPLAENLFHFHITLPAGWKMTQVTTADGAALPVERYPLPAGGTRIAVHLPSGIRVGRTETINYQATNTPAGWLADWTTQQVEFPRFSLDEATSDTGAIAAQTIDDLVVRPDMLTGLTPLVDHEKAAFGLADIPTALAYRFENRDFAAALVVERTIPSITARAYSFLKLQRDNLVAHYELNYDVREARTRRLAFSLPSTTPAELTVRGLGATSVKEFTSQVQGERRIWAVQLADRQIGLVQLAIDFTQSTSGPSTTAMTLPLIQAEEVEYQSALVAVEGDAELDVNVTTDARSVDIGELSSANYLLGRRVIGTFGYVGTGASVRATVANSDPYLLPAALIQRAELVTKVSAAGLAQSVARYDLLTKATLLELRLPPESTLWSVYLDDQPAKPQREKESLLLSLPPQERLAPRKLQIVYESPLAPLGLSGTIDAVSPTLLVRAAGTDAAREIPQADLQWQLLLPSGYSIRHSSGTVSTDLPTHSLAAVRVARFVYDLAGGIRPWYLTARQAHVDHAPATSAAESVTEFNDSFYVPATPAPSPTDRAQRFGAEDHLQLESRLKRAAGGENAPRLSEALQEQKKEDELKALRELGVSPAEQPASGGRVQAQNGRANLGQIADREKDGKLWALEGVRSLKIDIQADASPPTTFHSLGDQPRLIAVAIDHRRLAPAAWGLALLVGLVGIGFTFGSTRQQATYLVVVLLASTIPLLVTSAFDEIAPVLDYVFFAGCWLIAWYVAAAGFQSLYRRVAARLPAEWWLPTAAQTTAALLLLALTFAAHPAVAAPPTNDDDDDQTPVAIPADAIIIPYDPARPDARSEAGKILVPYAKYVELWNQAHPDKPLSATPPPANYAIAGTSYEAELDAAEYLAIVGRMQIEVFSDKPVAVPLHLVGGVLEQAAVDGQPARLQVVEPESNPMPAAKAGAVAAPPRLLLLHLTGKGRKQIDLRVRLNLTRQGGWRIVRAQLPSGPATALTLTIPDAGTEIRQTSLADRASFESKAGGEKIETALAASGRLDLQWRPKVAMGMVDQSLTAGSAAVFDAREDSLRLVWQIKLEFGRGQRDAFSFSAPADYLIERVSGDNVRGWTAKKQPGGQQIDVTLLKPVTGRETLTIELARRGRVGQGDLATFDVPAILVEGAALEQGDISVRKSPRLELRTLASSGLSRADRGGESVAVEKLADASDAAVLVTQPYQAFHFVRPPFQLTLAASEIPQQAAAEVKAALRIAERDTTLDASLTFHPHGQPLYRVRLYLPAGMTIDRIGPGDLEWSVTTENDRPLLTVQLLDGRTADFTLTLLGKLPPPSQPAAANQPRTLPLPRLEILDVTKQEGEIAVLPDPDTDVRPGELRNVEAAPAITAPAWMKPEQQPLARLVLRYRAADYSGALALMARVPLVSARTVTNVKITPRSIEETLLVNFRIQQAGIRRVSLLVPQHLAKARLKARLLKQKTIEPATTADGQPLAGFVRLTLDLQDYVRGDYAVLLEHDRLLATDKQTVALPILETGRTDRRLLAIENAGRDEVVIDAGDVSGLAPINRQEQAWRDLTAVLGNQVTQAYAAAESAQQPQLAFSMLRRQRAEQAAARIGLATTLLVVDQSGTYRALVQYRISNETEPYLQLVLPAEARLWTALVAGEPVKPAQVVPPKPGFVRVPLVKTAEGEGDYLVELKYGGRIPAAGFGSVNFPLIRETSIHVEQSIVRLLLPESHEWFDFRGTMRQVADEGELVERYQSYLYKRIQDAAQALASSSDYTKVRAAVNLKQSRLLLDDSRSMTGESSQYGIAVQKLEKANIELLEQAEQQVQQQLAAPQAAELDNRARLNSYFNDQGIQRSKNVVSDLASNFDGSIPQDAAEKSAFNFYWFEQNKLQTQRDADRLQGQAAAKRKAPAKAGQAGKPTAPGESRLFLRNGAAAADDKAAAGVYGEAGQKAPAIAGKQELDEFQRKLTEEESARALGRQAGGERGEELRRYQQNLEQNAAPRSDLQDQFGGIAPRGAMPGGGGGFGGAMPGGMPAGSGFGGGMLGGYGKEAARAPGQNAPAGQPAGPQSSSGPLPELAATRFQAETEQLAQVAAGLASLDVQFPERGRLYRFTTPRGDITLAARAVSHSTLSRLTGLAAVFVAIGFIWLLSRDPSRRLGSQLARSRAFGVFLALLGLLSLISGVLPVAGLLLTAVGIFLAVRSRLSASTSPTTAQA